MTPKSEVFNEDNMVGMRRYPDKYFELAIVDPPYGIGAENHAGNKENGWNQWKAKSWDSEIPKQEYWHELFRVSKNQIVWGANYMSMFLSPKMGWIVWDKGQRNFSLSDGELAWSSFDRAMRIFSLSRAVANQEIKYHPTQKPVALYRWLLKNYAKPGDKILDPNMGSQSSRIAAHEMGFDYYGWELDSDYFRDGCKRFDQYKSQLKLF